MLSQALRRRFDLFRLKLAGLPEGLTGDDPALELDTVARELSSLHDEASHLSWEIRDQERRLRNEELARQRAAAEAAAPPPEPILPSIEIKLPTLTGPQILAWSGGVVTLLGIVFFFVLASNNGWIGPVARLIMGALASVVVFGCGFLAHKRFETTTAALTAVGAGIAGGYATLLAAAALYDLLPAAAALVVATAIAAVGVVTALAWNSETTAAFGLVGAMLVPAAMILQGGVTPIGTAFVAAALVATGAVSIPRRWDKLLTVASVVGAPQIALLVLRHDVRPADALPVAAAFWLAYLGLGVARQLVEEEPAFKRLPVSLLLASAGVAVASVVRVFHGYSNVSELRGTTLLVVAAVYGAVGALLFVRRLNRDLGLLVIALGLTAAAVAGADLLSGASLAISWSAEAAILGWIAWQAKDGRFRLSAFAYLALALGHVLVVDAPPSHLFTIGHDPTTGLAAVASVIVAGLAIAAFSDDSSKRPVLSPLHVLLCAPAILYEAGFLLLWLGSRLTSDPTAFALGHVLLDALLAAGALAFVWLGNRRREQTLRLGGLALLGIALIELVFLLTLTAAVRWYALFPLAAALFGIALSEALQGEDRRGSQLPLPAAAALFGSVAAVALGLDKLAGPTLEGALGLAVAALIGLTALPLARRERMRDDSTLFWSAGLALAAYDIQLLLSGQALVLTLAAVALALVALSRLTRERRLEVAALLAGAWALGHVFWLETPPRFFVQQVSSPLRGLPSLLALVTIALGFAWRLRRETLPRFGSSWALLAAGALALLSGWLTVLGLGNELGGGAASFDWSQATVTILAAGAGAVALALARSRDWPRMWLFGSGALALALLKLVALDLGELNSDARGTLLLALAASLLAGSLSEELVGGDSGFARPWQSLTPLSLIAVPGAAIAAVAGIESLAAPLEIGRIDLAASVEIATGTLLFLLALALRPLRRDAATLLGASALGGYLFGLVVLVERSSGLSGHDIALAFSLTLLLLAVCLRLSNELRILIPLTAAAAAAVIATLAGWTPPAHLFNVSGSPADGILALVVLIVALAAAAALARSDGAFSWRPAYALTTAAAALYALSLMVLQIAQWLGGSMQISFEWGQVVVIGLWATSALCARELSRRLPSPLLLTGAAVAMAAAAPFELALQWSHFGSYQRTVACAVLVVVAVSVSLREQMLAGRAAKLAPVVLALASSGLAVLAVVEAFGSARAQGLGLVGVMIAWALVAAFLYLLESQRDLALVFASVGIFIGVAGIELVERFNIYALALVGLLAAAGALRVKDWRLLGPALVPLAVGAGEALSGPAAPRYLFMAKEHPGRGVPALACVIVVAVWIVWKGRRLLPDERREQVEEEVLRYARWALGIGILYVLSLAVLEVAQAFPGSLQDGFQRGHTAISVCWGALGLVLLYLGLTRTSKAVRLSGMTLLGASLAKIFLYDLSSLSSVQRAVSFLTVGVALLTGGFFYQRLAARLAEEQPAESEIT
jgi:uncharacterized membrane protein